MTTYYYYTERVWNSVTDSETSLHSARARTVPYFVILSNIFYILHQVFGVPTSKRYTHTLLNYNILIWLCIVGNYVIRGHRECNVIPDFDICDEQQRWHNIIHRYRFATLSPTGLSSFFSPPHIESGGTRRTPANVYIVDGPSSIIIIQPSTFQPSTFNMMKIVSTYLYA